MFQLLGLPFLGRFLCVECGRMRDLSHMDIRMPRRSIEPTDLYGVCVDELIYMRYKGEN